MITQDSGDSEILNNSIRDGATGAFKITLADGHVLQGGPIKGRPDFQTVSSWCNAVRQAIADREEANLQEAIARKSRQLERVDDPEEISSGEEKTPTESLDPFEYAEMQVDVWNTILHSLQAQHFELQAKLEEANRSYKQWSKIYETLNGGDFNEE